MSRLQIAILLGLTLAGPSGWAQQEDASQSTFRTGVERVLVPVIVRNRDGASIDGLQREHFRIYDEGELRPVTDFGVTRRSVSTQAASGVGADGNRVQSAADQPRFITWLFDDRQISFEDLEQARSALESHLSREMGVDTRAAVVASSGQVSTPFTSDRQVLIEAARRIKPGPATHTGLACPEISYYMADLIVNKGDRAALYAAAGQVSRCGPPTPPGLSASIARNEANRVLRVENAQTLATLKMLEAAVDRLSAVRGHREIILISSGLSLVRERAHLERILARAVESHVVISAINAHGVHAGYVDASDQLPSARFTAESLRSRSDSLAAMADMTGGRYIRNTNDIRGGLRALAQEPESVYLLAFAPAPTAAPGTFRKLKVEVPGVKSVSVQARRGYFTQYFARTGEVRELVRRAMMSPEDLNEIPLMVDAEFQSREEGGKLAVRARIGGTGLALRTCQDRLCNRLTVVYALFNSDGARVGEITRITDLRFNAASLKKFQEQGIQLGADFTVPQGLYSARVVVVDEEARRVAAAGRLVLPSRNRELHNSILPGSQPNILRLRLPVVAACRERVFARSEAFGMETSLSIADKIM